MSATPETEAAGRRRGAPAGRPVLEARGIVKRFGHVEALRGADFTVGEAEVVALIGDNGAGKSTLIKTLSGVHAPDEGELRVAGEPVRFATPVDARRAGVETVYQDLAVADDLSVAANLYLGREILRPGALGRLGLLDKRAMRRGATEALDQLGVRIPRVTTPIAMLSGGQRQSVAVARAIIWATNVVILDEPTAALGVVQTERVLDVVRRARDVGMSVVLVSHNMPQVLEIADRVEVLRLGRRAARFRAADVTTDDLVAAMTGAMTADEEDR
ncbi:ATP-binding cassette domain-containing protein [Streptomyces radicis]|uniref:Sugar ABC transporter ATP-binding protein n=1 Tax=Streptomyces radicis TaxID=1750517 RepID=A0A3A9VZ26_9ACTN|nr:ATP-binding cassette domain-containing protein [Streptomyces radicis]RKN05989.1 sugar ABC transporter ATP-binding protein [Streptomyces radicis]RKN17704.1 sugar ABC transporter ATP-binding protein [Streptomyces radicis]